MRTIISSIVVAFIMLLAVPAWAGSGAYRLEVPDAAAMAMGGAVAGLANAPSAVYYNPAGMTQLQKASMSFGLSLVQPKTSYSPESGNKMQMKDDTFFIPNFFYVTNLGEKVALGVGATSSWGLCTEWSQNVGAIQYNATHTELSNQDYMVAAGYKVSDNLSVGVGVDIDHSTVEKQKKIYQSTTDGNFKLRGDSTALGLRLATMYKISEKHQVGLMYRSPMEHKYKGKVHLDNLNNVAVVPIPGVGTLSYQTIFGGASYETDVVSKSRLPQSILLGYSFKPDNKWIFTADLEWMDWASVKEEELAYPSESGALPLAVLNNGNPVARDWTAAFSASCGAQYSLTDRLRLRGGYFFHQSPIPGENVDASLPDADSHSITTGFGYDITKAWTLDFAWAGMFFKTRTVNNNVNDDYGGIDGTYHRWVNLMLATATYSF